MSICSRVSILQGVKISIFPVGNWRRRYNSAALPRSLWWHCVNDGTCRIDKKTYSISRRISRFDGLNFDCATSSDILNCTNNFFDSYLPIHHTTFMALRFVLRPFTLRIPNASRNFSKFQNFDRFWLCPRKKWVNPNNIITNWQHYNKLG